MIPTGAPAKRCTGPCGRDLPPTAEYFYRHRRNPSGFQSRCKDCLDAAQCKRRAAAPKAAERACTACGRTLPVDAEHFHRRGVGFKARCKDCANRADAAKVVRAAADTTGRRAGERVKAAVREVFDREAREAYEALDELLTGLAGGRPPLPVTFQTTEGRRNFIRNHIATAPPGHAAEAADRARRIMAAAGEGAARDAAIPDLGPLAAIFERRELGEVP